jgi:putative ABC transport system permease protein
MSPVAPGRRAVLRWARRLFRREWRQQLLVFVMLTAAVAAAVTLATTTVNGASHTSGEFGDARAVLVIEGKDAAEAKAGVDQAAAQYGTIEPIAHAEVAVPGSLDMLDVRDQSPAGAFSSPTLRLLDGRYPTTAGEVALTRSAAKALFTSLGATVELQGSGTAGGAATTVQVVGIIENPAQLDDTFALVAPGTLPDPVSYRVLFDADPPSRNGVESPARVPGQSGLIFVGDSSDAKTVATAVFAASTVAMTLVGLLAGAAFLVIAQRRQRQLGLLAAIGARDRDVRMVMVAYGLYLGVLGAVVGGVLGVGASILVSGWVETAANHRIDRLDLPWVLISVLLALEVLVAMLAAWWPARKTSRMSVMAALSGRPAIPEPVHRSLLVALVLLGGGIASVAYSRPSTEHVRPPFLIGGLLGVIIGTVFVAPAAIRLLGVFAQWLPFAPRLALRDLARYQARAAAALGAVALGLGIAVAVIGVVSANEYRTDEGNLSSRELLIRVASASSNSGDGPGLEVTPVAATATETAALDARAARVVAAMGDGYVATPLDMAYSPTTLDDTGSGARVSVGQRLDDPNTLRFVGFPYVATPEVLALYDIDPASVGASTELLTSMTSQLLLVGGGPGRINLAGPSTGTQVVDLPAFSSSPRTLVTEAALERNGWNAARAAWIVEARSGLSDAQLTAARAVAAELGLTVESRSSQDGLATARTSATLIGAALALAVIAIAVGLIRNESARDLRTLTATGAAPRTRRALTASTAAALALLGVVLGIGGAYAALMAVYKSTLYKLVPVPVEQLVSLAVGLPLAAAVAGWCLAGRTPSSFSRQALD